MTDKEIAKLQKKRNELRCDLIFDHICAELLQEELIDQEDYQRIKSERTEPEKIDMLIEIIPKKSPGSLDKFIKILEKDYEWLATSLRNCDVNNTLNNKQEDKSPNYHRSMTIILLFTNKDALQFFCTPMSKEFSSIFYDVLFRCMGFMSKNF